MLWPWVTSSRWRTWSEEAGDIIRVHSSMAGFYFVIVKEEGESADLFLFYQRWVQINSASHCQPACPDTAAPGRGIDSQVVPCERTCARSAAGGADISHQRAEKRRGVTDRDNETWDTERAEMAELAGCGGWGQEVRCREPSSCWGWSHFCWMWVTLPGFQCALSPQAFIWSQGIWILYGFPRAPEYYTVSRSFVMCT